jgi:hypothetical protein
MSELCDIQSNTPVDRAALTKAKKSVDVTINILNLDGSVSTTLDLKDMPAPPYLRDIESRIQEHG